MNPTEEQEAYAQGAKSGGNVGSIARAGCGKTTLQKYTASIAPRKKHTLVVYNVKNADETKKDPNKPANLEVSTFHSLCLRSLGRKVNVKAGGKGWNRELSKMEEIILRNDLFDYRQSKSTDIKENFDAAIDACKLVKNSVITPTWTDVVNICHRYRISPNIQLREFADNIIEFVKESDSMFDVVDFDDMIRFCVLQNRGRNITSDMFIVDECQDNTYIRTLLMSQIQENTQIGFIGDDRQAIYFFAGADSNSIKNIIDLIEGVNIFPITVNFRCDKNIIREAQKIVPDIKYLESKEDGEVIYTDEKELDDVFLPGDVGIARYNRIIISKCFSFIKKGKPATVQGADFGKMLKSQIKAFGATDMDSFYTKLGSWYEKQCKYSEGDPSEAIVDRFECLKYLADNSDTVEQIASTIDNIFKDSATGPYVFSTGHRSKGLEWDRVHILDSNNFRAKGERIGPEQAIQEENLFYIAITRARHFLNFSCTQTQKK